MPAKDSILAHCIARAVVHDQGGVEAATAKFGPSAEGLSKWAALKVAARVTPKASRVASFISLWAIGMRESDVDHFSITEYQRFWSESERQAYRLQREFRELWPEFETPHELAVQVVKYIDGKSASKRDVLSLPSQLQVVA